MKAMILAAGLGTRLKPWTDHHPKALAVVNGKSLLERNIIYLQQHGIKEVIINVHHFADQLIDAIHINKGWGSNVVISDETDEVLETGGGLLKAATYLRADENFVLLNADILTDMDLSKMIEQHLHQNAIATLAVSDRESSRCLLFNDQGQMVGWRNKATGEERGPVTEQQHKHGVHAKAFSGIHVLSSKVFTLIKRKGKFSMIDVYLDLCSHHAILAFDHTGANLIDVGKPENIQKAEELFK